MDRNMDAYFLTSSRMRTCIGIAVLPRCRMPDGRAAACLPDCCVAATASRRGEGDAARAKGQGAERARRPTGGRGRRTYEGNVETSVSHGAASPTRIHQRSLASYIWAA